MAVKPHHGDAAGGAEKFRKISHLCAWLIGFGCVAGIIVPAGINWDFGNFYDAGRRILADRAHELYEPRSPIDGQPPQATTGFWGTPLTAYLYVPFALFPPPWALVLFKGQTAVFSVAALILLFRHNRRFLDQSAVATSVFAAAVGIVSVAYQPLWTAFRTGGQTTPFVLFLLVLALMAITQGRPFASACCFGFAVMVKPAFVTALIFFAVLAGTPFLTSLVVVFGTTGVMSIALFGWNVHAQFLRLMLEGLGRSVPWFYNSGLYVVFENLRSLSAPGSWPRTHEWILDGLQLFLKCLVVFTFGMIILRSRGRPWPPFVRQHFNFLMAISFFVLIGHIVYEAYLAVLLIVLVFFLATFRFFNREAKLMIGAICALSFWQNIIWIDLLRRFLRFESVPELVGIGLFKSAPVILLLVLLLRHHGAIFDIYDHLIGGRPEAASVVPPERL